MQLTMGDTSGGPANASKIMLDPPSSIPERQGEYTERQQRDNSPSKNPHDTKGDSRLPRDNSLSHRDAPSDDKSARSDDHNAYHPSHTNLDNRGNGNDTRIPSGDRAHFDRDRDRDREHDRDRGRDWERDRDRPRDRRPEFFPRSYGRSHAPRPPPEQRHYEPDYSSDHFSRRYEPRDMDLDRRGGYRNTYDGRRQPLDDRRPLPIDDRPSRVSRPSSPDGRNQGFHLDDRPTKAPLAEDRGARPVVVPSDDTAPVVRPGADERPSQTRLSAVGDDRAPRVSPSADPRPRPPVTLEERISQPAPSLQDRLSQPVPARVENVGRQPSLEERLSLAPAPATVAATVTTPSSNTDRTLPDDHSARSGTADVPPPTALNNHPADTRPPLDSRLSMPVISQLPRQGVYPPPARAASVIRDDPRMPPSSSKDNLPPVDRSDVHDLRASRDLSFERPASSYRSDPDRSFGDDRSRTAMDIDPARFPDTRGGPPPRRFSPPPPGDRGRVYYPPRSPSPPPRDTLHSGERRYIPTDRVTFDRRRDWYGASSAGAGAGADDDKRQAWRYERPPFERDNKDRLDHGRSVWDERDHERDRDHERERDRDRDRDRERDRRFPSPPPRSLSSRLTDPYPPPALAAEDRLYPPVASARDFDRPRYAAGDASLPFSRVRGRSPSPPRRSGVDDLRPPMKRMREEAPPAYASGGVTGAGTTYPRNSTYSPDRRASVAGEYVARSADAPPSNAGVANSNFYDARGPPPFAGGGDREYRGSGGGYGTVFDRSGRRSPPPASRMPPPYGRPMYSRGHDPRDDRRYMPPPPPRAA